MPTIPDATYPPGACRPCASCGITVTNCPHGWQAPFHARCTSQDGRHTPGGAR